jgi:hypothetical protein
MKKLLLTVLAAAMVWVVAGCSTKYNHTHYVLAEQCGGGGKQQARQVQAMLAERGIREELERVVNYAWREPWFDLDFSEQAAIVETIIATEHCLSDGRITAMNIFYNGHTVAIASGGKIKILKYEP